MRPNWLCTYSYVRITSTHGSLISSWGAFLLSDAFRKCNNILPCVEFAVKEEQLGRNHPRCRLSAVKREKGKGKTPPCDINTILFDYRKIRTICTHITTFFCSFEMIEIFEAPTTCVRWKRIILYVSRIYSTKIRNYSCSIEIIMTRGWRYLSDRQSASFQILQLLIEM